MSNVNRRRLLLSSTSILALSALHTQSSAQQQDTRTVRFIMPYAAGSGTDTAFRPYIDSFSRALKQPVIIDNRGGANGLIGMDVAAKSKPDGLTVTVGTLSTVIINKLLYSSMTYDIARDFDLVGTMLGTANLLTARLGLEANTIPDLIALAKRMPGKLKVASGGVGTTGHLSAALFDLMAGTQMVHVPYRSGAEAFKDMVNGDVDLLFENVALSQMLASGGKVKMMAVTSRTRVPTLPNVPSLDESGLKGYEVMAWAGFLVPKGTPQDIVARMNTAMRVAVADPEVRKATESFALIAMPGSPKEFQALIDAETPKWVDLVKRTGAKVD